MSDTYKDYLAARILSDGKPVTYRLLSRAEKVNTHVAKQMLYEFHSKQNAKKPNSIHATYLLTGKKRIEEHNNGVHKKDGDDTFMHSSPYMSSMPEPEEPEPDESTPSTSIVLVREEELEVTKAEFEKITSIHIYSLEPGPLQNLNVLSVCNQEVATDYLGEDPLERWRLYGSIHNPSIKRRTAKFAPPPPAGVPKAASKPAQKVVSTATSKAKDTAAPARRGSASEDNTSGRSTPQLAPAAGSLKRSDSKPNLKRDKSDIFKSFAKTKPKQKEPTPAPVEDDPMLGMSEDEGDPEDVTETKIDEEKAAASRKARAEREEKLRQMMEEDDDEEMPDAPVTEDKDSQDAPVDKAPIAQPAESETVTVQGGRRRGRRRVMKKKTVKDEDGYLVTREEAAWESFSEEEPEPKRPKPAPAKSTNTAKGKKTGKSGQGSIASFFKKA
ncbi:hypothetical protein P154DRAFT_501321 [Amniculicola lignicola CBS 123094]|uniref:DNA polymerase delta subunit 3 n=1 Tax=Amniculicola lignicola CBS 123094 TaxID=1392246 RepID=A0A6A5WB28_9PLEO|nr:hypothetical protein P154DRAFT_501321 [Amniculicola lignicola CBS 123094]